LGKKKNRKAARKPFPGDCPDEKRVFQGLQGGTKWRNERFSEKVGIPGAKVGNASSP